MAVITVDFCSSQLKMNTVVTLALPDSVRMGKKPLSERRVLYLLHGLSDDGSSWLRLSRAECYAAEHDIVLVMPSAGRSMYCDGVLGQNWFTHIADELPEYLGNVFGLSRRRGQNYIAGLSMGGMGAMKLALTFPERYAAAASFSGLLDLRPMLPLFSGPMQEEFPFLAPAVHQPDSSPLNPINLLDGEKQRELRLYIACGRQDDLLAGNVSFVEKAQKLGIRGEYVFEDGKHEWGFWDRHLEKFIKYISEN